MLSVCSRLLLAAAVLLLPHVALATPLGLSPGDIVALLEWDADRNPTGGGGMFTNTGDATKPLIGVDFRLTATLVGVTVLPMTTNTILTAELAGSGPTVGAVFDVGGTPIDPLRRQQPRP